LFLRYGEFEVHISILLSRPETEVNILMQQVAGDYGLEVSVSFGRLPHTPSLPPRTTRMSTRTTSHAASPSSRPAAKRISLFQVMIWKS
jgi:hypothetical protein